MKYVSTHERQDRKRERSGFRVFIKQIFIDFSFITIHNISIAGQVL
jgi:hypothetical protein